MRYRAGFDGASSKSPRSPSAGPGVKARWKPAEIRW